MYIFEIGMKRQTSERQNHWSLIQVLRFFLFDLLPDFFLAKKR
jgi:hypothetical protein